MKTNRVIDSELAKEQVITLISGMRATGKVEVVIQEYIKSRTKSQNSLYQVWSRHIARKLDFTHKHLKDTICCKFLGITTSHVKYKGAEDIELTRPNSTTDLSVEEFTDFLRKIEILAGELKIVLPASSDYALAMGGK